MHKDFDHALAASASSMDLTPSKLTIQKHELGDVTVLKLIGEILLDDGDLLFRRCVHELLDQDRTKLVVDFGETGRSVAGVNAALRERGIFGGKDLSTSHPELGQSALYCVTEVHSQADVDRLVAALEEVTR